MNEIISESNNKAQIQLITPPPLLPFRIGLTNCIENPYKTPIKKFISSKGEAVVLLIY